MEELVTVAPWRGRRVLVTGHTGFKGGWLSLWLHRMGAHVAGLSLPPQIGPSLFAQTRLSELVDHVEGDVREPQVAIDAIAAARPEIVFHLAAQPLVRPSYDDPVGTWTTNVMGTINVMEACRATKSVRALVCVTSDKCYENREWVWPYRESDPMGGHDPYSSSKGAAELAISAWRRSYPDGARIASVRAGNVVGGGDWAADRLIPDIVRSTIADMPVKIRNPASVRPWQHVLDALSGYLLVGERLLAGDRSAAAAWNFGPRDENARPVGWIVDTMLAALGGGAGWERIGDEGPHEAGTLRLDSSAVRAAFGWTPRMRLEDALTSTAEWYQEATRGGDARTISLRQIDDFIQRQARSPDRDGRP